MAALGTPFELELPGALEGGEEPWAVLVAGEHHGIVEEGGSMGHHVSLEYIGRAYACLRKFMRRERIIVIAQVAETIGWLESAAGSGLPLWAPSMSVRASKRRWRERLAEVRESMALLVAEGGATYDGRDVNPGTVIEVLRSLEGGRSILLGLYSHGWSHESMDPEKDAEAYGRLVATTVCDLCGDVHLPDLEYSHQHSSTLSREYYAHMPYPAPSDEHYGSISHAHLKYSLNYLYFQQLFEAYALLVATDPNRPIVALYNWCGSGGAAKFLTRPSYVEHYHVNTWPLYIMTSSGEMESSIVGLFPIWFEQLAAAADAGRMPSTSLASLFDAVEREYIRRNPELLYQEEIINMPCVRCRQFQGRFSHLCSACYKVYSADPAAIDLDALVAANKYASAATRASDEVSSARYPQALHSAVGEPSLATCSLADLFAS